MQDYEFNQLSSLVTEIVGQATGTKPQAPVTTSEFVSVAHLGIEAGYDPLCDAITQVLSRTIFSVRPYTAKFKGLMTDNITYGNRVRKLTTIDKPFEDDNRFKLVDGQSIDQQKVNKPKVIEVNITGANVIEKSVTLFKDQLDNAFSDMNEFQRYISMILQNVSDMLEQENEATARMLIANMIGGVVAQEGNNIEFGRVINLLEVYEEETGVSLTSATYQDPLNFAPFSRWLFGYLKTISDRMTNRSALYHQSFILGSDDEPTPIMRHTPISKQKCYLFSPLLNKISANVLSTVFYDRYLKLMDHEAVDFWSNINDPMKIEVYPTFTDADGSVVDITSDNDAVEVDNIFGVIFDEEACGMTLVNQWTANAPFNASGGYTNSFWHQTIRYFSDYSENFVVLLLQNSAEKENAGE